MSNFVPIGKKAVQLGIKHGPKAKVAWDVAGKTVTEQAQIQRARAANRRLAFEKARTLKAGSVLRQLHGDQIVWVVFTGEESVTTYPTVEVSLGEVLKGADLSRRQTPEEREEARPRNRARRAAQRTGDVVKRRRREDPLPPAAVSPSD